ncbi:MAG TPA: TadE/TadG family type IV pilus assembly protein [Sphingomicrobium sp.]|nr:TadE/TadG family type IV pilus assembly protein [Sphingomicrobium sp.]
MRRKIRADQQGAAVIETAIALPVLILFIYGIFVVGQLFQASAGMQHALGEAARLATIYPTPSDADLRARMAAKKFGTQSGTLSPLGIANGGTPAIPYKDLSLTYTQPTDFLFFNGPNVSLTRTKRVYLAV